MILSVMDVFLIFLFLTLSSLLDLDSGVHTYSSVVARVCIACMCEIQNVVNFINCVGFEWGFFEAI